MINKKYFLKTFLLLFNVVLLSFFAYLLPQFNNLAWAIIVVLTLIISIHKLEWGLYIVLAELFIGSMGYLFSFTQGGSQISLRIGLFLVVMAVWLAKMLIELIKNKKLENYFTLRKSSLGKWFLLLGLVLLWGFVWGIIRGNSFANVFFDSNGWLYFFYSLPFYDVLNKNKISNILGIFAAAVTINFLLTLFAFIIFTQNIAWAVEPLYGWIRDFRIGEITFAGGGLWRVFMQSQVFAAVGVVLFFVLMIKEKNYKPALPKLQPGELLITNYELILFVISSLTVVISLSRSYWVGCLGALGILFLLLLFKYKVKFKKVIALGIILIGIIALELFFVWLIAGAGSGELLSKRITDTGEPAGVSRWNQLEPLSLAIAKHPIIGSGFGTTVTYKTLDPRILKNSPDGWYTTYAFEWGYLDILLKIGLVGLVVYLILVVKIIIKNSKFQIPNSKINLGLVLGLVVILLASIFSPYMNHPLGIGYLILLASLK